MEDLLFTFGLEINFTNGTIWLEIKCLNKLNAKQIIYNIYMLLEERMSIKKMKIEKKKLK